MRWIKRKKVKRIPKNNETRIITRFLFFPKCINNEYRWLEKVDIKQRYIGPTNNEYRWLFGRNNFYYSDSDGFWMDIDFGN